MMGTFNYKPHRLLFFGEGATTKAEPIMRDHQSLFTNTHTHTQAEERWEPCTDPASHWNLQHNSRGGGNGF